MWKMECEDTLQLMPELTNYLSLIVSGTSDDDVARGWYNLLELEKSDITHSSVNLEDARSIMRGILRGGVPNLHQVPKLMAYFAKYVKKKNDTFVDDGDPLVNDYVAFVKLAAKEDITLLVSMVDVLKDYPVYGDTSSGIAKAFRAIVNCLATFQMPSSDNEGIAKFRDSAGKIRESLRAIRNNRDVSCDFDPITVCLETVYAMISDVDRSSNPGPGLIAILELVEKRYIDQAVKWIMSESRSDAQLAKALKTLCHWIPHWLSIEHLGEWIVEFMRGLENAKKYEILNGVADAYLNNILMCVILPMSSLHATQLTMIMLYRQPNPTLFRRITGFLKIVFAELNRQNTENSRCCLQNLVNVTKAMIERFPGNPNCDSLEKSFPLKPQIELVIAFRDERVWSNDYERFSYGETGAGCAQGDHGKIGLTNLGNTCYMNSVLQALAMTRQFSREVMRYSQPYVRTKNEITIGGSAVEAARIMPKLRDLFALLSYSRRRSISPTEILVASRPEYFAPKQQQDSSEFLCHLLDVLYEQEKSDGMRQSAGSAEESAGTKAKGKRSSEAVTPDRGVIKRWTTEEDLSEGVISLERKTSQSLGDFSKDDADEEIGRTRGVEALSDCHSDSTDSGIQSVDDQGGGSGSVTDATNPSQSILVHRVFGGESNITYQCAQCDTSSHNTDRFRDLQLCFPEEIADNQDISVQDLINYYLTPEKLTGDNKYRCDKCTKLCDAQRIIKILRAPVHLILTLKHFHYDPETRLRTKLRHKVTYNETIRLPVSASDPFSSSPIAETYRLYAAVVHSGYSMDYGHYVTYARDTTKNWYKFNDSFVTPTSLENFNALVPPVTPYILFYEKTSSPSDELRANDDDDDDDDVKPELSSLDQRIRDLVENDNRSYEDEMKNQADKKRAQRPNPGARVVAPSQRHRDNSDDENPPPSNCRGPIDIPANRFLF